MGLDYVPIVTTILVIIFIILIFDYINQMHCGDATSRVGKRIGNGVANYKGRCSCRDTPKECLHRLYWLAGAYQRENTIIESMIISLLAVILLILFISEMKCVWNIIVTLFVVFVVSMSIKGYKNHHYNMSNTWMYRDGIHRIGRGVGIDTSKFSRSDPPEPHGEPPDPSKMFSETITMYKF